MNKVILIGRLTKDPDLKFTPATGTAVCTFSMATNKRVKKEGQPTADFHNIVVWGKIAENTANYMKKGSQIGITGRLETRSYEDKEGKRRYVTEVVAEEVEFLSSINKKSSSADGVPSDYFGDGDMTPIDDGEDMPF